MPITSTNRNAADVARAIVALLAFVRRRHAWLWAGSVLLHDIADVKRLKQEDGPKLFADGSAPHSFKLTRSRVSPNGLIVGHYEREGKVKIGDTIDSPRERRQLPRVHA
jgi:hypothetical protein